MRAIRTRKVAMFGAVLTGAMLMTVTAACGTSPPSGSGSTVTLEVDGGTVGVTVPTGLTATVASADLGELPATPDGMLVPFGAIRIELDGVAPGGTAHLTVALPSPVDSVRKLVGGSWDPFAPDGDTGATLSPDGQTVSLDLRDGGRGDEDGIANGTIVDPLLPLQIEPLVPLQGVVAISTGELHACAVVTGGTVECWGGNDRGQLGDGSTTDSNTAVTVTGVVGATAVAAGFEHSCAVVTGGTVQCWGRNNRRQLGDGSTADSMTAVTVTGVVGATAIGAGYDHSCALLLGGTVKCWGDNTWGQLGRGFWGPGPATAVEVVDLVGATAISMNDASTCALVAGGNLKCWGINNDAGNLGDGTYIDAVAPVDVVGVSGATAVAAGSTHSCTVVTGGAAKCWGANYHGLLGDGTNTDSPLAVDVFGLSGATAISTGRSHTCAVAAGGAVQCWGSNYLGALGTGSGTNSNVPVTATGVTGATAVSANVFRTCVLITDGTVRCWGWNDRGQLGDGTNTDSTTAVTVAT